MKVFKRSTVKNSGDGNRPEYLVTASLLLVFVLVIITGILSFVRLNSIIYTMGQAIRPNRSLALVKDIRNDLGRAENTVKSYLLTRKQADLDRYNGMIHLCQEKMTLLSTLSKPDTAFSPYLDTLEILVREKFAILDEMVIVNAEFHLDMIGESARNAPSAISAQENKTAGELDLVRQDRIIMEKLRSLLAGLEERESEHLRMTTLKAENEASEVKTIIITFGIALLLLLLLAGLAIFLYIRRNNEYRLILRKARADAEQLARAREQFLANMSHEIRTPMNVISGYLGQLLDTPLQPQQKEQLGIIKRSSDHLLQLLSNLLDLSRLQAQKLDLIESDFHPAEVVQDICNWLNPKACEKHLELISEIGPGTPAMVSGDPVRLRQVLFNLAGNAVKFTEKGSVRIRMYPGDNLSDVHTLIFEISDTGIGIAPEDIGKIFREFEQGSAMTSKSNEGTGLGLAITLKLVSLMNGTINVNSTPGEGSVFTVKIPFKPAQGKESPDIITNAGDHKIPEGLIVMVVDDESYNRGLLRHILGKYHCEVHEAQSGEEALALMEKIVPGIILMDVRMPGMSGTDVVKQIRRNADAGRRNIPVIALSAGIEREEFDASSGGFDDFIPKPFEESRLIQAIVRLVIRAGVITPSVPAQMPVFSLEHLRKESDENHGFFLEMVHLFLENTGKGLSEMELLIADGKLEEASELAHKLSAPCRHLKAEILYSRLKMIERDAPKGLAMNVSEALIEARAEFESIRQAILAQPEFKNE